MAVQIPGNQSSDVSRWKIVLSAAIWFVVFLFMFVSCGNVLLPICSIWYLLVVTPLDDPRRKVRMVIVGFYSLAFSLLYIVVAPRGIVIEVDPLTKYVNVCAILAYAKLLLGIGICIKAPFVFSQKGRRTYQQKLAKEKATQEAELEEQAGVLRGTWSSELRNQIAEALKSGDETQIEWAMDELEYHSGQGVEDAGKMLKDQSSGK